MNDKIKLPPSNVSVARIPRCCPPNKPTTSAECWNSVIYVLRSCLFSFFLSSFVFFLSIFLSFFRTTVPLQFVQCFYLWVCASVINRIMLLYAIQLCLLSGSYFYCYVFNGTLIYYFEDITETNYHEYSSECAMCFMLCTTNNSIEIDPSNFISEQILHMKRQ